MNRPSPLPLSSVSLEKLSRVKALFFDIDDTFSGGEVRGAQLHETRILPEAYDALWQLYRSGIFVVPVTGRPAGWCDFIARMWPVSAVVGENGAFYSYLDYEKKPSRLIKKYLESKDVREKNARSLKKLHRAVQKKFPGAQVASDQQFREFDLAIDYCEDVRQWPETKVTELLEFCRAQGAIAKLSSIHVNTWFGRYDKLKCVRRVLSKHFNLVSDGQLNDVVYIGDSPNDEPFFENFAFSVGVANVRRFLGKMEYAPAYITKGSGGVGFAELAQRLLEAKR